MTPRLSRSRRNDSAALVSALEAEGSYRINNAYSKLEIFKVRHREAVRQENYRSDWEQTHRSLAASYEKLNRSVSEAAARFHSEMEVVEATNWFPPRVKMAGEVGTAQMLLQWREAHEAIGLELSRLENLARAEAKEAAESARRALAEHSQDEELEDILARCRCLTLEAELRHEWRRRHEARKDEKAEVQQASWSEDEERAFEGCTFGATSYSQLMERLRLRLPYKSEAELSARCEAREGLKKKLRVRRAFEAEHASWRRHFFERAKAKVEEARIEALEQDRCDREHRQLAERRAELASTLQSLRRERCDQEARATERARVLQSKADALEEQAVARNRQAQAERRDAIAAYKASLAAARAEAIREEERALHLQREQRKHQLAACKKRVEFRTDLAQHKAERRSRQLVEAARTDLARLRALAKVAASVPYANAIANIKANPLKPTAATLNREHHSGQTELTGLCYADLQDKPIAGFTDAQLFKDDRFKLAAALRDAGIAQTSAAKDAVHRLIFAGVPPMNPITHR